MLSSPPPPSFFFFLDYFYHCATSMLDVWVKYVEGQFLDDTYTHFILC